MHLQIYLLFNYIFVRMLPSMLQTVCQSLSDTNQVVRSAGLFALGQFSEHLQASYYRRIYIMYILGFFPPLLSETKNHLLEF